MYGVYWNCVFRVPAEHGVERGDVVLVVQAHLIYVRRCHHLLGALQKPFETDGREVSCASGVGCEVVLLDGAHPPERLAVIDAELLAAQALAALVHGFGDFKLTHLVTGNDASVSHAGKLQSSRTRDSQQAVDRVVQRPRAVDGCFQILITYLCREKGGIGWNGSLGASNRIIVLSHG